MRPTVSSHSAPVLAALIALALCAARLPAQTFDSGSDGSDGALAYAANLGTVDFSPAALGIDGSDNTFNFSTITVASGTTVRLRSGLLGEGRPVVWLASGDVQIDGVLDLNGVIGHEHDATSRLRAEAGAGGFNGGRGNDCDEPSQPGNGPGGGGTGVNLDGGGAGHTSAGSSGSEVAAAGMAYGNSFLQPLVGGSGGGGGFGNCNFGNSGGGGGGGALLVASSTKISVTGSILARGGRGGPATSITRGGGGGSGGAIRLVAPEIEGNGTLDVRGGAAPSGRSGVQNAGSAGRIRLEAFARNYGFQFLSSPVTEGKPGFVFLPPAAPKVTVTSIDGVAVPADPTGDEATPDVTVNANGGITISIEATKVPVGTEVKLTLNPENGDPVTVTSTPLQGTLDLSTATATASFPFGFTRLIVTASWTP